MAKKLHGAALEAHKKAKKKGGPKKRSKFMPLSLLKARHKKLGAIINARN